MLERLRSIKRIHLVLGVVILLTLPCYLAGLIIYWNDRLERAMDDAELTATATIDETLGITPTFTIAQVTETSTPTPTQTLTFTATITYVIPNTETPTPTPTPTLTFTPTLSPTATTAVVPSNTPVSMVTPETPEPVPTEE
jgi:hypothetical protein